MISVKVKSIAFPLRMPRSMRQQVEKLAEDGGISINKFVSMALTEKISRLEQYFQTSETPLAPVDE